MLTPGPLPQRDERVLVVWAYDLDNIIPTCRDFEDKLIKLVWAQRAAFVGAPSPSASASAVFLGAGPPGSGADTGVVDEKAVAAIVEQKVESSRRHAGDGGSKPAKARGCGWGLGYFKADRADAEQAGARGRPVRLLAPLYSGIAAALSVCESRRSVSRCI